MTYSHYKPVSYATYLITKEEMVNTTLERAFWITQEGALEVELENAARLLEGPEFLIERSGIRKAKMEVPFSVEDAIKKGRNKSGVYIIYRGGRVVDSGKAAQQDLGNRIRQHFEFYYRCIPRGFAMVSRHLRQQAAA